MAAKAKQAAAREDALRFYSEYKLGEMLRDEDEYKIKSAYSKTMKKEVAIKIMYPSLLSRVQRKKFLPRELEIIKGQHHPNIAQVYEILHFNHKIYIVMERVGEWDLLDNIDIHGNADEDTGRVTFYQLASALSYLHAKNIVHRNLRPESALLDLDNNVKLSDFGFARVQELQNMSRTFCGTFAYSSPELLQGLPYSGFSSDMWSLGVLLYTLMCDEVPFIHENVNNMVAAQMIGIVGYPEKTHLSDNCKSLITSLLNPRPEMRPTAAQVLTHPWLENVVRDRVVGYDERHADVTLPLENDPSHDGDTLLQVVTWTANTHAAVRKTRRLKKTKNPVENQ